MGRGGGSNDLEKDIQKRGLAFLRSRAEICFCYQNDPRRRQARKWTVSSDRPKGLPDVVGMFEGGRLFAVEFKKPGGKVTPEQTEFLEKIKASGGASTVAYSVEDLEAWLNEEKLKC